MDISPVNAASQTARAPESAIDASAITSDFETFLKMLTAQLRNQDPLNPVEADDYAVQLATFSSVEQQVLTNTLLQDLAGVLGGNSLSSFAGWVGQEVRVAAPVAFDGDPVTVAPVIPEGADRAILTVRDAAGNLVTFEPIPTDGAPYRWSGADADGDPLPEGTYQLGIQSFAGTDMISETQASIYAEVIEVQVTGGAAMLVLEGGTVVDVTAATGLRSPAAA